MALKRKPCFSFCVLLMQFIFWQANADVYMHNPRGSNNRLNENSQNRANANRLFDSQNNNNGGYNVGDRKHNSNKNNANDQYEMEYFMSDRNIVDGSTDRKGKSFLNVEWTNQHGCGDDDLNCNIVLQYKCQHGNYPRGAYNSIMRNGVNTGTQPENRAYFDKGLHESWEWYDKCKTRERNKGLFAADQKVRNDRGSRSTRQNPNGDRRGYECPEERDYYPYWHPTDWIDEMVFTKREEDCPFYKAESFNHKMKGECLERLPRPVHGKNWYHKSQWNNMLDCESNGGEWVEFSQFLGIGLMNEAKTEEDCMRKGREKYPNFIVRWALPYRSEWFPYFNPDLEKSKMCLVLPHQVKCKVAPTSRPNHLGNGDGVVTLNYQWAIPYIPGDLMHTCVFRIRYNISTDDYNVSSTDASANERKAQGNIVVNQSPIENNPVVQVGENGDIALQLAINTAQFGRTFQDRSHTFKIIPRPAFLDNEDRVIHNINVRGKRGNIVQVYPAVEYDFTPKRAVIKSEDFVHFQYTGSNSNPGNFDGEGRAGTDRSNIVQMASPDFSFPITDVHSMAGSANIVYRWGMNDETQTNEDLAVLMASSCRHKSLQELKNARIPTKYDPNGLKKYGQLDEAPPSCSMPLIQLPRKGEYFYMCTRNNNFSNRSQKGRIHVE